MMTMTTKTNRAARTPKKSARRISGLRFLVPTPISSTTKELPVTVTPDGLLLLPEQEVAALAQLVWQDDRAAKFVWQNDQAERDRFVKRTARRGISTDEFRRLVYGNGAIVFRQLKEWGIFQKVSDWFLQPEVAQVTSEWLDQQRRDLKWANLMLTDYLIQLARSLDSINAGRRKGTTNFVRGLEHDHRLIRDTLREILRQNPKVTNKARLVDLIQKKLPKLQKFEKPPSRNTILKTVSDMLPASVKG